MISVTPTTTTKTMMMMAVSITATTRSRSPGYYSAATFRHLACCLCLLLHIVGQGHATPTPARSQKNQTAGSGRGSAGDEAGAATVLSPASLGARNLHYTLSISNATNDGGTLIVPDIDSYTNTQLYALLIDILEKLNVLAPKAASCYRLHRVEHEVLNRAAGQGQGRGPAGDGGSGDVSAGGSGSNGGSNQAPRSDSPEAGSPSGSGGSRFLGVYLYFTETPLASWTPGSAEGQPSASSSSSSSSSSSASAAQDQSAAAAGGGDQSSAAAKSAGHECVSYPDVIKALDAQPLLRDGSGGGASNASGAGGGASGGGGAGESDAGAGRHVNTNAEYHNTGYDDDDEFSGLSLTQVVVISTCSAIICIFFVVAFVLRVRNYLKRLREEQLQAQRPTFRSCSVRLRSVSHSNEQVRRDSQISKISHQSTLTNRGGTGGGLTYSFTNGSTSRENSNASSPHHDSTDTKPLLLLPSSAANSTTNAIAATENHPQHSPSASLSSSLQFIDEEPPPRKSDRSASRATPCGADDSEARPLLACSEVSANSLRLSPASPLSGHAYIAHTSPNGGPAHPPPPGANSSAPPPAASTFTEGNAENDPNGAPCYNTHHGDTAASPPGEDAQEISALGRSDSDRFSSGRDRPRAASVDASRSGQALQPSRDANRRRSDASHGETHPPLQLHTHRGRLSAIDDTNDDYDGSCSAGSSGPAAASSGAGPLGLCGLTQSDSSLASQEGLMAGGAPTSYGYGTQAEYAPPDLSHAPGAEYINGITGPYRAFPFLSHPSGPLVLLSRRAQYLHNSFNGDSAIGVTSGDNDAAATARSGGAGIGDWDLMTPSAGSPPPGPTNDVTDNDVIAKRDVGLAGEDSHSAATKSDAAPEAAAVVGSAVEQVAAGEDNDHLCHGLETKLGCAGDLPTDRPGLADHAGPPVRSASNSPPASQATTVATAGLEPGSRKPGVNPGVSVGVDAPPGEVDGSGVDGFQAGMTPRGDVMTPDGREATPSPQTDDISSSSDSATVDEGGGQHSTTTSTCQNRLHGATGPAPAAPLPTGRSSWAGDPNRQPRPVANAGRNNPAHSRDHSAGPSGQTPPSRRGGPSREKTDQSPGRRYSTPAGAPEPEVVMKRLFSFDDSERTTFL